MSNQPDRDLLNSVRIAAPCSARWEEMPGGERVRSCAQCGHKVYNLSAMSAEDASALIREAEGRVCVRLYRRADGSVMTRDCPTGLRAVRRRVARSATVAFTSVAAAFAGLGFVARYVESHQAASSSATMDYDPSTPTPNVPMPVVMGTPAPSETHLMGYAVTPASVPTTEDAVTVMGRIARPATPLPMVAPSPDPEKSFLPRLTTPSVVREDPFSPLPGMAKPHGKQSSRGHGSKRP